MTSRTRRQLPVAPDVSLTGTQLAELRDLTFRSNKITAIKRLREMRTLSLSDAKKVVDVLHAGGTVAIRYVREQTGMGPAEAKSFVDALR